LTRIKWVNEVLHRATAKVWVLRMKTHEWTEEDFESLLMECARDSEGIRPLLYDAVNRSLRAVT
jgi:hypothetical protein